MRTLLVTLLCTLALTSITGCGFIGFPGVYRINVEQGNIIEQEKVDQLKIGMNRRQVRFILGTPLIEDSFNPDRWDYTHVIRNGRNLILEERLTVFFDGDELSRLEGDFTPSEEEVEEEPQEALAMPSSTVIDEPAAEEASVDVSEDDS